MKPTRLTPMIYTAEVQTTVEFYEKTLGFKCMDNVPEWGWARVQLNGADLMISAPNDHMPFDKPVFTGSFYFNISDVDKLWEQICSKVKVSYPIADFDYGMREFGCYDNNGYLLQFGQEINPSRPSMTENSSNS